MASYTITRITEEPTLENGKPAAVIRVEFTVGTDGPFFERWPKSEFTDYLAQQKLSAFASSLERLRQ